VEIQSRTGGLCEASNSRRTIFHFARATEARGGQYPPGEWSFVRLGLFHFRQKGQSMRWFQHDSGAHRDLKLRKLFNKYGFEGIGLYWTIVGLISESLTSSNVTCELELTSDFLAEDFRMAQERVDAILNYCVQEKLFDRGTTGNLRCLKLMERLDNTLSKSPEINKIKFQNKKFRKSEESLLKSEEQLLPDTKNRLEENTEIKRLESVLGRPLRQLELDQLKNDSSPKEATA